MGLSLPFGGHLTHGAPKTFSSTFYRSVQYEVDKEDNFAGESAVEWPADGLDFVESIIRELKHEKEPRDGSHR